MEAGGYYRRWVFCELGYALTKLKKDRSMLVRGGRMGFEEDKEWCIVRRPLFDGGECEIFELIKMCNIYI